MATLEVAIKLTFEDGRTESTTGDYTFNTDDEAEDMYWAFLGAAQSGSKGERDTKRGKANAPGQNK